MLFGGGLIPTYIIVNATGLIDTIWALVLPGAVGSFSAILLLNFIRGLPRQLEEAAYMDGAGHWRTLFSVVLPLSLPVLATLTLFSFVGHWNSWFDGIIYMNSPAKYPLQSYLKTVVLNKDPRFLTEHDVKLLALVSDRTTRAAEIFVAMVPVMAVYPFLQRYFISGIVVGSVKG
jgi:putative aldouronate transport system permease protein